MAHHHHPEGDSKEDLVDAWLNYDHDDTDHNHKSIHFDVATDGYSQKHHHHHPVTRFPISHIHTVKDGEGGHRHMTDGGWSSAANHTHPRP